MVAKLVICKGFTRSAECDGDEFNWVIILGKLLRTNQDDAIRSIYLVESNIEPFICRCLVRPLSLCNTHKRTMSIQMAKIAKMAKIN